MTQNDLQSRLSLCRKYSYENYQEEYISLYIAESARIKTGLTGFKFKIYHIGSTAIPGVGGKGVIDIAISALQEKLAEIADKLSLLGYEFRASGGDTDWRFFQSEIKERRYHIHLTEYNSKSLIRALAFRDFLRENPSLAGEYSQIKRKASKLALQMDTKEKMKETYAAVKNPVIEKILKEIKVKMNKPDPKVSEFISRAKQWKEEFEKLRKIVLDCGLSEELKWGKPSYSFQKSNIVLIHGFKEYCALLFFKGVLLKDPSGILIQQTENVQAGRQIRFTNVREIVEMESVLKAYINEAIEVEKAGLEVNFKKSTEFVIPEEFQKKNR
jgi:uncharacterized protein YdeI (YjbR/CyaY-like superfamily)